MNFAPTELEWVEPVAITLGIVAISSLLITFTINLLADRKSIKNSKSLEQTTKVGLYLAIASMSTLIVTAISGMIFASTGGEENFEANVMAKYKVDKVLTDSQLYPMSAVKEHQQIVVIVDGQQVLFEHKQNLETYEPTLINPPINGSSDATKTISAKDLLRK